MLVLSRRIDEELCVGDDTIIKVVRIEGGRVRLGITAPHEVRVVRGELLPDVEVACEHPTPAVPQL